MRAALVVSIMKGMAKSLASVSGAHEARKTIFTSTLSPCCRRAPTAGRGNPRWNSSTRSVPTFARAHPVDQRVYGVEHAVHIGGHDIAQ